MSWSSPARLALGAALLVALVQGCGSSQQSFAPLDDGGDDATGDDDAASSSGDAPSDGPHDGTVDGAHGDGGKGDAATGDGAASDGAAGEGATGDGGDGGAPEAATGPVYPPLQPIGANMPDLFLGYLGVAPGGASAAGAALDDAKAAGITHVRFIASGFYPSDMTTSPGWVADPTAYFAALDATVSAANSRGIKLVPSLLWNVYLFPDINGEPAGQLFVKGSKSRTMAEKYVTQVVSRYAAIDGILYWELGNELNLAADMDVSSCTTCDGGANYCAGIDPPRGTPCGRTAADEFYSCNTCRGVAGAAQQDLGQFTADIATLVAGLDKKHLFSSGDAYPRPAAWHLAAKPCPACDYTPDTAAQYQQALLNLHPAGVGVVSVHHSPGPDLARFGSNDQTGAALLTLTQQIASNAGKTLYVGEFGQTRPGNVTCNGQTVACGGEATWAQTRWVLDDLVAAGVPRAAVWGLDFFQFCAGVPTCNSVIPSDPVLGAIATHNAAASACQGTPSDAGAGADAAGGGDGGAGEGGAAGPACPIGACVGSVCTPTPQTTYGFDTAGALGGWTLSTNCTSCTPGTATIAGLDGGTNGYVTIASSTLPCTGSCSAPGVYELSPKFPLPGPNALVRVDARSTGAASVVDVIPYDASNKELAHSTITITAGGAFASYALWFPVPAGAVNASVRLELTSPSATLDVDDVEVVSEP
jgi:hypothetical protein